MRGAARGACDILLAPANTADIMVTSSAALLVGTAFAHRDEWKLHARLYVQGILKVCAVNSGNSVHVAHGCLLLHSKYFCRLLQA